MSRKQIEAAIEPEFMAKLKQLKIKTRFMNNVMNPQWSTLTFEEHITRFLNATTWYDFIDYHCRCDRSFEKCCFWENIQNK